ncbi:MAG: hypothetical protein JO165_05265, partial [Candidatus Eremiobacteraeota bacterium]|nr:hypothetical protein [Candidatus Eremiobacteraeota bacterium]
TVRWNTGNFDAILNDDAGGFYYLSGTPCNTSIDDWMRATADLQGAVGYPVIYNALEVVNEPGVPRAIALNKTAIGGMMEECYAAAPRIPKQSDWKWRAAEDTELRMAHEGKLFFCYNNDTSPADQSIDNRIYVYASYLLTYDPRTSVLWEYYMSPTRAHVMPEVQFVPFDPVKPDVKTIDDLKNRDGVYVREYRHCYLNGQPQDKCIVAVNSDNSDHHIDLRGYSRGLTLSGGGIFDGGKAQIQSRSMPDTLPALSAIIAVR